MDVGVTVCVEAVGEKTKKYLKSFILQECVCGQVCVDHAYKCAIACVHVICQCVH